MKKYILAMSVAMILVGCGRQEQPAVNNSEATPVAEALSIEVPGASVETGKAFETPLPAGVVLQFPYNARSDVRKTAQDGTVTRRTDFEFLTGDSSEAMAAFASAMQAAGFKSGGPKREGVVVRQGFMKPGYGYVSARAEMEDAAKHKHPSARGFIVTAWPRDATPAQ